jgi:hypothetical protein
VVGVSHHGTCSTFRHRRRTTLATDIGEEADDQINGWFMKNRIAALQRR